MPFRVVVFNQGTNEWSYAECPGEPPKPTCMYFGSVGRFEYSFVPAGNGRLKARSKVVGQYRDEEGTKNIWEPIPEGRQFEIPAA